MSEESVTASLLASYKNIYTVCLLSFTVVIAMGLIFNGQTKTAIWVAVTMIWVTLLFLPMVEGFRAASVGNSKKRAQKNMGAKSMDAGCGDMPKALEALMKKDPKVAEFIKKVS
mmetsp:Transcript_38045/g.46465  ORF Transcript_38045/g.46465 Transcript_38045/m.46465 type:complete len:114 (+) Transcript_38045:55-396(+)|eukprot:CAMPEP_0172497962 /NCGR_PEP_ID=MMETSP1066-20121228/107579_1 /TAXON_ID=671091 /ORGANISM="Coscinodiscus wailesii, Strain CCMP2513" /LENGTH=113 /DNA_ID=CAMNT_0013271015 /DNA_START=55 /DNA_END=396 /DNA_ORIENTATION=-